MLNTNKPIYKVLLILNLVLLAISVLMCFVYLAIPELDPTWYLQFILYILAIVAGFIYVIGRYKKNSAFYYKGFMFLFCLTLFAHVYIDIVTPKQFAIGDYISIALEIIICIILSTLTFAKNIGEKATFSLACSLLGIVLLNSIWIIFTNIGESIIVFRAIVNIALSGITCLFVLGKYMDKEERGSE